jgi:hypothetical protein
VDGPRLRSLGFAKLHPTVKGACDSDYDERYSKECAMKAHRRVFDGIGARKTDNIEDQMNKTE